MNYQEILEDVKLVKLSDSNRQIISDALEAYKNISVYQVNSDDYIEVQSLEIDEILEKIKD
jgi:hypothetical protein